MAKRYVVVDQNVLRRGTVLKDTIATQPHTHYVLPDLAFLEMTKSPEWESTLKNSLRVLAQFPRRVHVAHSVNETLYTELSTMLPISGHMLNHEATSFVRNLLSWVRTGKDGYSIERMRADPDNHRAALAKAHLDHTQNKTGLRELIDETKSFIPEDLQKRMRGAKVNPSERLQVVYEIGIGLLLQILAERGVAAGKARALTKRRPLLLRYFFVKAWYCVYWIEKCGFDSFPEKDVSNEKLDQQYVLTASFFHGVLSEEKQVNDAYQDLCLLLRKV